MKSTKDAVYEFVRQSVYSGPEYANGVETKEIAAALGKQRSNISTALNELIKEGKLIKSDGRPVLYKLTETIKENNYPEFGLLVGHDGSLKSAVQLAKAAILYPKRSLNILISSKGGCGTTYFATGMHGYALAKGVLKENAPFVKINCRHYTNNTAILDEDLFGKDGKDTSAFERARGGMLFIDCFDLLNVRQQNRIFTFLDTGCLVDESGESVDYSDVYLMLSCSASNVTQYNQRFSVVIELPELSKRPLTERFDLINAFFGAEAQNSKRSIEVTSETIKALLLTDFVYNVKELRNEIVTACANAYVRVVNENDKNMVVVLNDFSAKVKRSLLMEKEHSAELNELLSDHPYIQYDQDKGYQGKRRESVYHNIQRQYEALSNRGVNPDSIENTINTHIKNLFNKYSYHKNEDDTKNLDQLSKIVDRDVIKMVTIFLDGMEHELGKKFKSNVFYGLCLHINSLIKMNTTHQRISNDQIVMTIQDHPKEYAAASKLANLIYEHYELQLDLSEIVILAGFLMEPEEDEAESRPVLLYIMHGNGTASSLRDVTNALTQCENAYSYDLTLETDSHTAMEELRILIQKIDRGAGIIVIYDMGSIKTMIDALMEEIDVKIRYMNIPVTLIGIDVARKCSMENDIDAVYHIVNKEIWNLGRKHDTRSTVIVTLCHTGEGGALHLKNYIDQNSRLGLKTIALAISNRTKLLNEVMEIRKTYTIHAFVGTYDPKLLGIPFIPISKVFDVASDQLDRVLMFEPIKAPTADYNKVYDRLDEQFKYTSIAKLKSVLPSVVDELTLMYSLNSDQMLGIFVHLACLVERILSGGKPVKNPETDKIIQTLDDDYRMVSKMMKKLEKTFKIIIDDNEIATIIMMVKKI